MGTVLGKISVETPRYEVVSKADGFEVREYAPCIVAETTYDPASTKSGRDGGFMLLADYIGAVGKPNNNKAGIPEKIDMTAPVVSSSSKSGGEKIAMTAPVLTHGENLVTMQFVLPSKYTNLDQVPSPNDTRVVVKSVDQRKFGVLTFNGVADDGLVKQKTEQLRKALEAAGHKISGDLILARYNPPWTPGFFRTNEVMLPVE